MALQRASGVLAHPTSFPGPHGIGDIGEAAFRFIDWLAVAGQRYWQVMPLGPTGFGDSPYASPSAFAGNPLLISLAWLAGDGLLEDADLALEEPFPDHEVRFGPVITFKNAALRSAFNHFRRSAASSLRQPLDAFTREEGHWLDDFALYMALKDEHGGRPWAEWDRAIRLREPRAMAEWSERLQDDIRFYKFVQFLFRRQWTELKRYTNERDVRIVGDIPIFVAHDSADVWANQELFQLDGEGQPTVLSGVPPDLFTDDGQLWGNPLFDWERLAATGYRWWIDRVRALQSMVDVVRIDHFRGFAAAWTVPASAPTAAYGRWERGPGRHVFDAIVREVGDVEIVVEDLGLITPDVVGLREELGFPGMKVLQFAFDDDPDNVYLPHTYDHKSVVYTGTHDNQTTIGWFQGLDEKTRRQVQTYLGRDGSDISWDMIRAALASTANLAIFPLQDAMRLGDEARMNTPGRPMGNWGWRYLPHQLHHGVAAGLGELTTIYGRRAGNRRVRTPDDYDYSAAGTQHRLWPPIET